jgi:protein-disulfide isomerase
MPKTTTKKPTVKKATKTEPVMKEAPKMEPTMNSMNPILMRLSQQFNLLAILLIALFLFQAYTFYKLKTLETTGVTATAGGTQQESPLTEDKLVSYAKDLNLDTKQFEQCIKDDSTKQYVDADAKQAADYGVQGTPGFFINGRFLGGAFPYEAFKEIIDKELAGQPGDACTDYSESMQQYCSDPQNAGFIPAKKDIVIGNAPSVGPKDAPVTIVEYSDFECPFCQRAYPTVEQVMKEYNGKVRLVYKQLPLTNLHPHAQGAALASVCAQKQNKFWEYYHKLFQVQGA